MEWNRLSVEWGSHEPGDGPRQEVLVVDADVAGHGGVPLPEELRGGLELRADLDEAVQLHAGTPASDAEALHQGLGELGAQVVAHLSESWGREAERKERSQSCRRTSPLTARRRTYLAAAPWRWWSRSGLCRAAGTALSTAAWSPTEPRSRTRLFCPTASCRTCLTRKDLEQWRSVSLSRQTRGVFFRASGAIHHTRMSHTLDYGHDTLVRWNVQNATNHVIVVVSCCRLTLHLLPAEDPRRASATHWSSWGRSHRWKTTSWSWRAPVSAPSGWWSRCGPSQHSGTTGGPPGSSRGGRELQSHGVIKSRRGNFAASNRLENETAAFGVLKRLLPQLSSTYSPSRLGRGSLWGQSLEKKKSPEKRPRALYLHIRWDNQCR